MGAEGIEAARVVGHVGKTAHTRQGCKRHISATGKAPLETRQHQGPGASICAGRPHTFATGGALELKCSNVRIACCVRGMLRVQVILNAHCHGDAGDAWQQASRI